MDSAMRAYTELAEWWPLFSPPSHYVEEAQDLLPTLRAAPDARPATALELGAGGGSLAFHLKQHITLTLSDVSSRMTGIMERKTAHDLASSYQSPASSSANSRRASQTEAVGLRRPPLSCATTSLRHRPRWPARPAAAVLSRAPDRRQSSPAAAAAGTP
jgi:hypothetical protein